MIQQTLVFLLILLCLCQANAQQLLSPSNGFSHKKTSYVTLTDGTEIKGTLKDIDRKKGLIKFVKIIDGAGTKYKLKPTAIKHMYLPPTRFDNAMKALDFLKDAQKWNNQKLDQDLLKQGYVYFESVPVKIKKKSMQLLMQLLNPTFSKEVKVYHDPFAKETMGLGVGGVTVAGGNAKSYYVAKGEEIAYRLKKKDYRKEFVPMWQSCQQVIDAYPDQKWANLVKHILAYSECK